MVRDFLHYKCKICGARIHKKGLCSDCSLKPKNIKLF